LQEIEGRGNTPIIVGGTNYYTETLLYYLAKAGAKGVDDEEEYNSNEEEGNGDKQTSE
jgi:tRNA A37 N6-isopentenylltransferase MiaA